MKPEEKNKPQFYHIRSSGGILAKRVIQVQKEDHYYELAFSIKRKELPDILHCSRQR